VHGDETLLGSVAKKFICSNMFGPEIYMDSGFQVEKYFISLKWGKILLISRKLFFEEDLKILRRLTIVSSQISLSVSVTSIVH
jgi:hypothetical protein